MALYSPQDFEKDILAFWEKNKTFDKLRKKNAKNARWSFTDGPITANNLMGVHHASARTIKDLYQRYKAMQGYHQRYQNGFDCHIVFHTPTPQPQSNSTLSYYGLFSVLTLQGCKKFGDPVI